MSSTETARALRAVRLKERWFIEPGVFRYKVGEGCCSRWRGLQFTCWGFGECAPGDKREKTTPPTLWQLSRQQRIGSGGERDVVISW